MTLGDLWLLVPVLCLTMYIILDGYDLGIGILLLAERDRRARREAVEVVAQTWDINESWLILLGVSLWAGFPAVFGAALPHLYVPVIVMLLCLIVRGFSTELISHRHDTGEAWVTAFSFASLGAAIAQGVALAGLTRQITLTEAGDFVGPPTPWDVASVVAAVVVVAGVVAVYVALGAAFLRTKVDSPLAVRMGRAALVTAAVLLACIVGLFALSIAPLQWSGVQGVIVAGLGLVAAMAAVLAWRALGPPPSRSGGYRWTVVMVVAALGAVLVGRYPVILVPDVTVVSSAAPSLALIALLIGVGLNIALISFYTIFAHRTFSGPVYQEPITGSTTAAAVSARSRDDATAQVNERPAPTGPASTGPASHASDPHAADPGRPDPTGPAMGASDPGTADPGRPDPGAADDDQEVPRS